MKEPKYLREDLNNRQSKSLLRYLRRSEAEIDFSSNDYLGFASSEKIYNKFLDTLKKDRVFGSRGSRLLAGNTKFHEEFEKKSATFFKSEASLLLNSGYNANLSFFTAIPKRNTTVFYDAAIHASIREGLLASHAKSYSFKHNDVQDLVKKIKNTRGDIFVSVESLYSMDGDLAPLKELVTVCEEHGAYLVVDEAHAVGIYGDQGEGLVAELKLEDKIFARIVAFGKAFGGSGACILGSQDLKDYLVNYARAFIYTTALPVPLVKYLLIALEEIEKAKDKRKNLWDLVSYVGSNHYSKAESPIVPIIVPGNEKIRELTLYLNSAGFNISPVLSPTVPVGQERLRLCLHSYNSEKELDDFFSLLNSKLS